MTFKHAHLYSNSQIPFLILAFSQHLWLARLLLMRITNWDKSFLLIHYNMFMWWKWLIRFQYIKTQLLWISTLILSHSLLSKILLFLWFKRKSDRLPCINIFIRLINLQMKLNSLRNYLNMVWVLIINLLLHQMTPCFIF